MFSISRIQIALWIAAAGLTCMAADPPAESKPFLLLPFEEKYSSEVEKAEIKHSMEVAKADSELSRVKKAAGTIRLKAYKDRLTEVTKTGDFNKALGLKARLDQLEKDIEIEPLKAGKKTKPKDAIRFAGHTYALVNEPATWHLAKRRCEEMGGHLAVIDSENENTFLLSWMQSAKQEAWVGATDELKEGEWVWVTGARVKEQFHTDNASGIQHYMLYHIGLQNWDDGDGGARHVFVCEWDE